MYYVAKFLLLGFAAISTMALPLSERSISDLTLRGDGEVLAVCSSSHNPNFLPMSSELGPPLSQTFRRDDTRKIFLKHSPSYPLMFSKSHHWDRPSVVTAPVSSSITFFN